MTYPSKGKSGSRVGNEDGVGKAFIPLGVRVEENGDVGKAVAVGGMGELVGELEAVEVLVGAGGCVPQAAKARIIASQEKRFRNAAIIMYLSCQSILGFCKFEALSILFPPVNSGILTIPRKEIFHQDNCTHKFTKNQ